MRKQNDFIFDVGMHRGEDADFYLRKGFRVIGFEAEPGLAAHCRARFANEIGAGRLAVIEGAIVENHHVGETVRFYKNKDDDVWGTVHQDWAKRNELFGAPSDAIEVQAVDFAGCLKQYGVPHYLKVDIEGSDAFCLQALLDFDQRPDYISIESEKISFAKLKGEFLLLEKLGYTSFRAIQQQTIPGMRTKIHDSEYQFENGASGPFGEDLPGKWKSRNQILAQYRLIFLLYRLYGDYGRLNPYRLGRESRKALERISGKPMPGWYDTHAKLASYCRA